MPARANTTWLGPKIAPMPSPAELRALVDDIRRSIAPHIEAAGSADAAVLNIVTHLNILLTDEQKAKINWHPEQSVSLAVMRIITEWTEALGKLSELEDRLLELNEALDCAHD